MLVFFLHRHPFWGRKDVMITMKVCQNLHLVGFSAMRLPIPGLRTFDEQDPPGNIGKREVLLIVSFRFNILQFFYIGGLYETCNKHYDLA